MCHSLEFVPNLLEDLKEVSLRVGVEVIRLGSGLWGQNWVKSLRLGLETRLKASKSV